MKIKKLYRLARRWKRKLQKGLWLLWLPLALACDIVSLLFLCQPISETAARIVSFMIVHAIAFAAASRYVEDAAAASEMFSTRLTSLLAPAGEKIVTSMTIHISSDFFVCCSNLLRLLCLLLLDVIILLCVCARFVLACATSLPITCTLVILVTFIVLG